MVASPAWAGRPAGHFTFLMTARSQTRFNTTHALRAIATAIVLLAAAGCAMMSGCAATDGPAAGGIAVQHPAPVDQFPQQWGSFVWATRAWHLHASHYARRPESCEVGQGFRAGYLAEASGSAQSSPYCPLEAASASPGMPPAMPERVAAWREGYTVGAAAAARDRIAIAQHPPATSLTASKPAASPASPAWTNPRAVAQTRLAHRTADWGQDDRQGRTRMAVAAPPGKLPGQNTVELASLWQPQGGVPQARQLPARLLSRQSSATSATFAPPRGHQP